MCNPLALSSSLPCNALLIKPLILRGDDRNRKMIFGPLAAGGPINLVEVRHRLAGFFKGIHKKAIDARPHNLRQAPREGKR